MSRFERQVSWLPTVAPTVEFDPSSSFDVIWQPQPSVLPTLPETPPSFADDYQPQIHIDSIIDQRHLTSLLSASPPLQPPACSLIFNMNCSNLFVFFFVVTKPTRSKLPIRSQEKHSRAISPSPYESPLPSQKRTKSSTNIHENEPVLPGASQYVFLPSFIGSIDQSFLFLKLKNCS